MEITIGILSGGSSKRFGADKGLAEINGVPMVKIIYNKVKSLSEDIIILLKDRNLLRKYYRILGEKAKILYDVEEKISNPVIGAYSCFKYAKYEYTLLLACDLPLIKTGVIRLLIEEVNGYDAVVPVHPNGYIEPLHAIYHNKKAIEIIKKVIEFNGNMKMRDFISRFKKVNYVSTDRIKELDPNLEIFYNVNTVEDIKRIRKKFSEKE
ncbi:MAG: molybdenum cofactor guanylyltransferase [Candidatus Helarchaeota archaeon]